MVKKPKRNFNDIEGLRAFLSKEIKGQIDKKQDEVLDKYRQWRIQAS